jgi:hypothetical protein
MPRGPHPDRATNLGAHRDTAMQLTLEPLAWLFTAGVLAHNLEEALYLPAWSRTAGRWHAPVGRREFAFAVTVLSGVLVVLATLAFSAEAKSLWAHLFTGYVFAMVVNVLVPHVAGTVALRRYLPGTATAVLFNLPLGGLFLHQALAQGFVDGSRLVWFAPATAVLLLASIPLLFALGRRLLRVST